MNKVEIMRQPTLVTLLQEMTTHQPGISSQRLFDVAREWDSKLKTHEFEGGLEELRTTGYRVTNKRWYPAGHSAPPQSQNGSKARPSAG